MHRISIPLAGLALASGNAEHAAAVPKPMALNATFANWPTTNVKVGRGARCPVRIASLEDLRRSPEMIGVFERRPIYSPQDRAAWLKSIIMALSSRGINVAFDGEPSPPDAAVIRLGLTTAWIANTDANVSASAVFKMRLASAKGETTEGYYRGSNSRMPFWSTGPGIVQKAMDVAFAGALDAMATELLRTCQTR